MPVVVCPAFKAQNGSGIDGLEVEPAVGKVLPFASIVKDAERLSMQEDVFSVLDSTAGSRRSREFAVDRITVIDRCRAAICTLAYENAALATPIEAI